MSASHLQSASCQGVINPSLENPRYRAHYVVPGGRGGGRGGGGGGGVVVVGGGGVVGPLGGGTGGVRGGIGAWDV